MGSNDKISKELDHNHVSEQGPPAIGKHIKAREGPCNPERGRLMAADKGLSTCNELTQEMKQASLRGRSFAAMREKDRYYVDKTLLIKDLIDAEDDGVFLFTRPRRFGKTTNLTMLDAFFNLEYKGNTWFDGLEISKHPKYDAYKNAFPVVHIDLKDTVASSYSEYVQLMKITLRKLFSKYRYLLDSECMYEDDKKVFDQILAMTIDDSLISYCIPFLCEKLEAYHGSKAVVLIDEYDRAVSDAFGTESHRPMMDLLGKVMSAVLKSNETVQMAYVTGVMQIAEHSIFSGLNNITINNVFSEQSDERFGFTEAEVRKILEDSGYSDKFELAKRWYDGYRFGDAEVYNPYSIMKFISNGCDAYPYWIQRGKDVLIKDMLNSITPEKCTDIMSLVTGGSIESNLTDAFQYEAIEKSGGPLYSLMVMSGYLKAAPADDSCIRGFGPYNLSIPNEEVRMLIDDMMKTVYPLDTSDFSAFCKAILDEDAKEMEKVLIRVMNGASYINLNEATYAAVIMTLTYSLSKKYKVKLEVPEGKGRVDIEFYPKIPDIPPMIFELKVAGEEKDLDAKVAEAFEQIHDREYYNGMEGRVILVGMAFWNKVPKIEVGSVMNGDGFALSDEKAGRI